MTLHLHYWPTPNGKKVTIFLEEAEDVVEALELMMACELETLRVGPRR